MGRSASSVNASPPVSPTRRTAPPAPRWRALASAWLVDKTRLVPALEGACCRFGEVGAEALPADGGRGQDRAAIGLVVERDVARHHREVEGLAGVGDAADRAHELAHDLRPLGVAEIEIVGDG